MIVEALLDWPLYSQRLIDWLISFTSYQVHFDGTGGQCEQIWRNFSTWDSLIFPCLFLSYYLVFGKIVNLLWQIFPSYVQIFSVINGQILNSKIAIWSHCQRDRASINLSNGMATTAKANKCFCCCCSWPNKERV